MPKDLKLINKIKNKLYQLLVQLFYRFV
jgi:hypothetical protein